MRNQRKEIECIARLQSLSGNVDEILEFLLTEKFITSEVVKATRISSDIPREMQKLLSTLSSTDKFQLLEYEWTVLPVERIKIIIVTDRMSKEFTYNF